MDRNDPNANEEPRRPYDRLRKILDAGEDSTEGLEGLDAIPGTGSEEQSAPEQPPTPGEDTGTQPATLEDTGPVRAAESEPAQASDLEDTGPVRLDASNDDTGPVRVSAEPTADGDDSLLELGEAEESAPESPAVGAIAYPLIDRHPTGEPESTGGWYGQGEVTPEPEDPSRDATVAIPPKADDDIPTQPVKVAPAPSRRYQAHPGQPLPQRVEEVDRDATRVAPSAYGPSGTGTRPGRAYQAPTPTPMQPVYTPPPPVSPTGRTQRRKNGNGKRGMGCFLRGLVALLFVMALVILCVGSFGVYQYFRIASTLPPVDDLRNRSSQFETTRILDRNGNMLYEILDPNAGRRTWVPLDRISPYLIAATIATEDKSSGTIPAMTRWR